MSTPGRGKLTNAPTARFDLCVYKAKQPSSLVAVGASAAPYNERFAAEEPPWLFSIITIKRRPRAWSMS